jgi:hypothetical protein
LKGSLVSVTRNLVSYLIKLCLSVIPIVLFLFFSCKFVRIPYILNINTWLVIFVAIFFQITVCILALFLCTLFCKMLRNLHEQGSYLFLCSFWVPV